MRRVAAALVLLALVGCGPPRVVEAPGLADATGNLAVYDWHANTISIDSVSVALVEVDYPGAREWVLAHEFGHWVTMFDGLDLGPGLVGLERKAQCWAELDLGHGPPFPSDDARGYWACPDWALELVRQAHP